MPTLLSTLKAAVSNKNVEKYTCHFTEPCDNTTHKESIMKAKYKLTKKQIKTKKFNERRKVSNNSLTNNNGNFIQNLSEEVLTDTQISLLTKGLKCIPTATVKKNKIKRQLLQDFKAFARRMRFKYIFHGQNKPMHPFYAKSNWKPPVQPSVTLEHYLEEVKLQIADTQITRPKHNLSRKERKALSALKQNKNLNFKKVDKGTTRVMNKNDKIQEGQVQINDLNNYKPLVKPIVKETHMKVSRLISELSCNNYIDDMTKKWLSQTPYPHREYPNSIPSLKSTNLLL